MVSTRSKVGGSTSKGSSVTPAPRKQLTTKERGTREGKFAVHLAKLMADKGITSQELAKAIGVGDPAVRRWLRAEVLPSDLSLVKEIGTTLGLKDWRQILPIDL